MSKFEENIKRSVKSLEYIVDMQAGKDVTVELTHYTAEPPTDMREGEVVFTILVSSETGSPELYDIAEELSKYAKKTYNTLMGYTFNSDGVLVKRTEDEYYESGDMMGFVYKLYFDNNNILKCEFSNYYNVFLED